MKELIKDILEKHNLLYSTYLLELLENKIPKKNEKPNRNSTS